VIRFLDIFIAFIGLVLLSPVLSFIFLMCFLDTRSPLFLQPRVGLDKKVFTLIKFRTMFVNTPSVPSHLSNPMHVTKLGGLLRKFKLDELPQLYNVLRGDMSLVGPRPNLVDQYDLIRFRERLGVFSVRPGITGRSQLLGLDMSSPEDLAIEDARGVRGLSVRTYFRVLFLTLAGRGYGDAIK